MSQPTAMAFAPDGRIFVTQQGGAMRVIKNGSLLPTPFIELTVDSNGERGLLGVAFDPSFSSNQFVYLYYTVPGSGGGASHNRVSRFMANGDVVMAGSETILMDLEPLSTATNHNGGVLAFGPDGKLYIGVGENANGSNAQTLENRLGKVLRINSDGSIPADNPFFSTATGNNRAIWSYGLRNPYTLTFQPGTGRLFVNDVGQDTWEEINDATSAGLNFGWPIAEGPSSNSALTNPVFSYPHGSGDGSGCAITGGAFYNPVTTTYPANYTGKYFYQDLCNRWINYIDLSGGTAVRSPFATNLPASSLALTLGNNGNLYYLSRGAGANTGVLYEIVYSEPATMPMITGQPSSITVMSGQPAIFVVSASGNDLSYQWLKDGMVIQGATGTSYLIPSATTANQGQYQAVVSNPVGSVTSTAASLVVQPVVIVDPAPLSVIAPLYNCQTGAITFQTTGGNGAPIEYFAIGVTPWTSSPNQVVEAGLRADPKPIQLFARQSGVTVSYTFDLPGFCSAPPSNQPPVFVGPLPNQTVQQGMAVSIPILAGAFNDPEGQQLVYSAMGLPVGLSMSGNMIMGSTGQVGSFTITIRATDPGGLFATGQFMLMVTPTSSGSALQLMAPLYNCQTGAITFQTTGGNGTMIEYFAIGITPWTTNPNQTVEAGLRADPKIITLNARQSGMEVSYQFNLPAACAATRIGNPERDVELSAQIFPNPVRDVVTVGVEGAQGQRVRFILTDLNGRQISELVEDVTSTQHRTTLNIANKASGMYLLRVSTNQKAVSLKVLKQ